MSVSSVPGHRLSSALRADHERSSPAFVSRPPRPPLPLLLLLPDPDPASRPGGPGRPLRSPPVRLGLHGHHLHPQAGGGAAVLQRVLGERRAGGLQHRGALHVPDPHGGLGPGPAGEPSGVPVHVSGPDRLLPAAGLRPPEPPLCPHHPVWIRAGGERDGGRLRQEGSVQSPPGDDRLARRPQLVLRQVQRHPGVGAGLFWRGEDGDAGGVFPGGATQEAALMGRPPEGAAEPVFKKCLVFVVVVVVVVVFNQPAALYNFIREKQFKLQVYDSSLIKTHFNLQVVTDTRSVCALMTKQAFCCEMLFLDQELMDDLYK